jgi:hypothetical protein
MIETPLRFFEVNEEFSIRTPRSFAMRNFAQLQKDSMPLNMIFSSREFIFMVVNAVVLIAICYQSIVSFPAIGIDIAAFNNSALKNWHKLCLGTVVDDTQKHPSLSFMQAQNRDFTKRSSSAFATNPPGSKIAFINFNIPDKRLGFLDGHINYMVTKHSENPMNGIAIDRTQIGRRCGRDVLAKTLQNPSEFDLRNV